MSDVVEESKEKNLSKCSSCQEIKTRICVGKFPDGRNKKYADEEGKPWVGRKCPSCVKNGMKARMREFRAKDKSDV